MPASFTFVRTCVPAFPLLLEEPSLLVSECIAGASSLPASRPPRLLPIQKITTLRRRQVATPNRGLFLPRLSQHYQVILPHAAARERRDCFYIHLLSKCSAYLQWHWIDPLSSFETVLQKPSPICLSPTNSSKQYTRAPEMFAKIRGEGGPQLTHFCKLCDVEDEMSSKPYSHFHG
jgi:hypothetical protein